MAWRGGQFSTSYKEIMSHLFDHCIMADGTVDKFCVEMTKRRLSDPIERRDAERASQLGMERPTTYAEWLAYRNWQMSRYGGNVQSEAFMGAFERPAALYALKTKGRVTVDYGSALPSHYEVNIEGPFGSEKSFDFHDRGSAAYMQKIAEQIFGRKKPRNVDEERALLKELFELYRILF